jgi:hypothetical protein
MTRGTWDNACVSKWTIAGAWVLVAAVATTLTWQIVSAADAQVSDQPPIQVAPAPSTLDSSTSTSRTSSSTSSSTSSVPSSSSSTSPGSSSTSAPPNTGVAWSSRTVQTGGGVVVVSYRPDQVVLSSASPAAGFSADIKKQGPPEVDVEFESEFGDYRVRARWANGDLAVETESEDD